MWHSLSGGTVQAAVASIIFLSSCRYSGSLIRSCGKFNKQILLLKSSVAQVSVRKSIPSNKGIGSFAAAKRQTSIIEVFILSGTMRASSIFMLMLFAATIGGITPLKLRPSGFLCKRKRSKLRREYDEAVSRVAR